MSKFCGRSTKSKSDDKITMKMLVKILDMFSYDHADIRLRGCMSKSHNPSLLQPVKVMSDWYWF
jgi:hypothetical protein